MPTRSQKPKRPATKSSAERVRSHRAKLRAQGLRPVQIWLPDTSTKEFIEQAHRESLAVANSPTEAEDQAFIDSITDPDALYELGDGLSEPERQPKRGEIWTTIGARTNDGRQRQAVLLQRDHVAIESVIVCYLTTDILASGGLRVSIRPSPENGLSEPSWVVVEGIAAIPKRRLDRKVGDLGQGDLARVGDAIGVLLDLAPRSS